MNHWALLAVVAPLILAACGPQAKEEGVTLGGGASAPVGPASAGSSPPASLAEARKGFRTRLIRQVSEHDPAPQPPAELFRLVRYESPAGPLAAYVSPPPADGAKHPAILWIVGGFDNGIGSSSWEPAPAENDQSASAFREAGLVMMFPSLRGGNDNPGVKEGFFGEVDDVLAAAEFLAKQEGVDPARIYLGGHSTGGTLALLAAESTDRFRATFSFGPADDVAGYGPEDLPFDLSDRREVELRAPVRWLAGLRTPTFVFEGADGNVPSLRAIAAAAGGNPLVHGFTVPGKTHFSVIRPLTRLIAEKIGHDDGPTCTIQFTQDELDRLGAG